jgi:hypothetical protein
LSVSSITCWLFTQAYHAPRQNAAEVDAEVAVLELEFKATG